MSTEVVDTTFLFWLATNVIQYLIGSVCNTKMIFFF